MNRRGHVNGVKLREAFPTRMKERGAGAMGLERETAWQELRGGERGGDSWIMPAWMTGRRKKDLALVS